MTNLDYLYNKDVAPDNFDKNHFVDKKLHFKVIEHGTILPHKNLYVNGQWTWGLGGIVDKKFSFIESSFVHNGVGGAYTPTEEIFHSSSTVIYLGLFYPVWGHCLTDNIRRLWFLKSDVCKEYFKDCPIVYIPWGGKFKLEDMQNFRRLLELLEIEVDKLQPIYYPIQFENIILPDESFYFEDDVRKFTNEYRETIEVVKNFALKNQTSSAKKIYYFYGRNQIGEEKLAEYFSSKGYEIISPEKLTLDEQLNLLINAESFASTLGSCAHNSLFLREGTECIFIPRVANRFRTYQTTINQINKLNAVYIDSTLSIFVKGIELYCFIISEQLKKFFGDKFEGYAEDDLKTFLTYLRFALNNDMKINPNTEKYYDKVLGEFLIQLNQREDLTKAYGVEFL